MYICQLTRLCGVLCGRGQAIGACPLILFTVFGRRVEVQYTANRCGVQIMRMYVEWQRSATVCGPVKVVQIDSSYLISVRLIPICCKTRVFAESVKRCP